MVRLKVEALRLLPALCAAAAVCAVLHRGLPLSTAVAAPLRAADTPVVPGTQGQASWYGPRFHGRPTASGEPFDRHALTAAHRSLPFGTRVRVENLRTGRSVEVRINDRGPFGHRRRIIDLSEAAGRVLGLGRSGAGLALVRITILPKPRR